MITADTLKTQHSPDIGPVLADIQQQLQMYYRGHRAEAVLQYISVAFKVFADVCLASDGNTPKAIGILLEAYESGDIELTKPAIEGIEMIVDSVSSSKWSFVEAVLSLLPRFQPQVQLEAVLLCAKMIARTVKGENRWHGVQPEGYRQVTGTLLRYATTADGRIAKSLCIVASHPLGNEEWPKVVAGTDKATQRKVLELLSEVADKKTVQTITDALLQWNGNKEEYAGHIEFILARKDGKELAAKAIEKALENTQSRNVDSWKGLVALCVDYQRILPHESLVKLINGKIWTLLNLGFPEAEYPIHELLRLTKIPDETVKILKTQLDRLRSIAPPSFAGALDELERKLPAP